MPFLTPAERVTLELIRDTGVVSPPDLEWAKAKGCAQVLRKDSQYYLTEAGIEALARDAEQRRDSQSARRPRMR
jgi:hypothetical protein